MLNEDSQHEQHNSHRYNNLIQDLHCLLKTRTMNNTSINTTASSTNKLEENSSSQDKPHVILQTLFSFIAVLAFCGNGLLCVVILRRRRFLRSSYNLLIFSLGVTDMLTGKYNMNYQKIFDLACLASFLYT